MRITGVNKLIKRIQRNQQTIDDDVEHILKENAKEFRADTVLEARKVMVKGYWTGNLASMIEDTKQGKMSYIITSNAHYSGFLEYGTRYMEPETFMKQIYQKYGTQVNADLERLLK